MKPRVFVTRRLPKPITDLIENSCSISLWPDDSCPPREVLLKEASEVEGILTVKREERIDAEIIRAAPSLKVISHNGVGCSHVDVAEATARGVIVANTVAATSHAVADFTVGLMIAVARRIVEYDGIVRSGGWTNWPLMSMVGQDVYGRTLGIVGLGVIGLEVAKRAKAFNMRILYCDPHRRPDLESELGLTYCSLEDLLRQADFVSLSVRLTESTRHLLSAERLRVMKPSAFLINTARGGLVDQNALADALTSGCIAGAALDVTEKEPIPPNDALLAAPNCIITPHRAAATYQARLSRATMAARNLVLGVTGEQVLGLVNPEALSRSGKRP